MAYLLTLQRHESVAVVVAEELWAEIKRMNTRIKSFVGFIIAYPMNWWLVANHLKHGMMTVRPTARLAGMADHAAHAGMERMMEGSDGRDRRHGAWRVWHVHG